MTSFEDCRRELLVRGGQPAQNVYARWLARPGYQEVHTFVQNFDHHYMNEVTVEYLRDVTRRSDHALGDVNTKEQLPEVENWTTHYAFEHLFHMYLEAKHEVPTWQEFDAWLHGDAAAFLITPLRSGTGWDGADSTRRRQLERAYQWRIGKFYYSAVKELDLFVRLRQQFALPVRYHILADVLLRTDLWLGDNVVCIYFPNPRYHDGDAGRKPPAENFLGRATPPFRIHRVAIEAQGFGKFWLATNESVQQLARILGA